MRKNSTKEIETQSYFLMLVGSPTIRATRLEKADILIFGCTVLPLDGEKHTIEDGAIAIKNGIITYVGRRNRMPKATAETKIYAGGKIATPGLVNSHTHLPMTLFRGMAEDLGLDAWLKQAIWPMESKLRPEDTCAGALLGCLEMIKSGTTCFADMHFHEDKVAEAAEKSGLRASLAEGIFAVEDEASCQKLLKKSLAFVKQFKGSANGRVNVMLGPHSAYSCGAELLRQIAEKASELDVGIHMHLAESKRMFQDIQRKYRLGEVDFLDRIGFLKDNVLAAHCIYLSEKERRILSKHGVNVAYVPVANMKLGLGIAKIRQLADLGLNVGLGTDGAASNNTLDMFDTMKVAALLQKLACNDPAALSAYETLSMATLKGAKALGLDKETGSLEVGKKADLILIDFSKPHLKPLHDVYAGIVYSARGSDVDTVIVDGKILMENRKVRTLNEEDVMREAESAAFNLLSG
jgi:5-methylthioadenosine/S-adenosylhomocysteine deaminase